MLTIILKRPDKYLHSASRYFKSNYDPKWMYDPEVKQMVMDIDKSELIPPHVVISPVLDSIPVTMLSGGVQGLICIKHCTTHRVFSSCIWGSNCVEWIRRLSFECDFSIYMEHGLEWVSGIDGNKEVKAQTQDGRQLNTTYDIWSYYAKESNQYFEHNYGS